MKIKVQHFFDKKGKYVRSLKYYSSGKCPVCGIDILQGRRMGKTYILDADRLYLLEEGNGVDSIYKKNGVRHFGKIVTEVEADGNYIAGYLKHECMEV